MAPPQLFSPVPNGSTLMPIPGLSATTARVVLSIVVLVALLPAAGCRLLDEQAPSYEMTARFGEAGEQHWRGRADAVANDTPPYSFYIRGTRGDYDDGSADRLGIGTDEGTEPGTYRLTDAQVAYTTFRADRDTMYHTLWQSVGDSAGALVIERVDPDRELLVGRFETDARALRAFDGYAVGDTFRVVGSFRADLYTGPIP